MQKWKNKISENINTQQWVQIIFESSLLFVKSSNSGGEIRITKNHKTKIYFLFPFRGLFSEWCIIVLNFWKSPMHLCTVSEPPFRAIYETNPSTADMSLYFDCATMHSLPFHVGVAGPIKRRKKCVSKRGWKESANSQTREKMKRLRWPTVNDGTRSKLIEVY